METPVDKRPESELHRVIENQTIVIENQRARIEQLEELLRNSDVIVPVPELPDETWIEILSYLSTFDVLRNIAQVSKRFHKLSQDPDVIRKIEVESFHWPEDKKEKYCADFLGVLKRSLKLRSLSFGSSWVNDEDEYDTSGEKFLESLPSMNHQFLQELCLKGDGIEYFWRAAAFLDDPLNENIFKYLEKCSDLKVLKFEFKPEVNEFNEYKTEYPPLYGIEEAIKSLKVKNLQEFHLIGVYISTDFEMSGLDKEEEPMDFKNFLDTIAENFPKLQRLCLTCEYYSNEFSETLQAFASGRNIKVEISRVEIEIDCKCTENWMPPVPIKEMKIYGPR